MRIGELTTISGLRFCLPIERPEHGHGREGTKTLTIGDQRAVNALGKSATEDLRRGGKARPAVPLQHSAGGFDRRQRRVRVTVYRLDHRSCDQAISPGNFHHGPCPMRIPLLGRRPIRQLRQVSSGNASPAICTNIATLGIPVECQAVTRSPNDSGTHRTGPSPKSKWRGCASGGQPARHQPWRGRPRR